MKRKFFQKSSPCYGPYEKHRYRIYSSHRGHWVIMQCAWIDCRRVMLIEHEELIAMVAL